MGVNQIPPKYPQRYALTLTSGTSWTVPAGVTTINVTLQGGGGGGGTQGATNTNVGSSGYPGQIITSNLATTPGASISYSIGAGGVGAKSDGSQAAGAGGTTTFTGATSATGGNGGTNPSTVAVANAGTTAAGFDNSGRHGGPGGSTKSGGDGGSGRIDIEYWV